MLAPFALAFVLCAAEAPTADVPLALTIDDLPWVGDSAPNVTEVKKLIAAIGKTPATGFVTCKRARQAMPAMQQWLASGIPLGNHTTSHKSLDSLGLLAWLADVDDCDKQLSAWTKKPVEYFRYPFLLYGSTEPLRDAARKALAERKQRIAHVSLDASDWAYDDVYVRALRQKDSRLATQISDAYVQHLVAAARHYKDVSRERLGRDVAEIIVLHANALNAAMLPTVLAALKAEHFRFVSLDEALKDPLYQQPDAYSGGIGMSYLYRIAPAQPERWEWDRAQMLGPELRFGRGEAEVAPQLRAERLQPGVYRITDVEPWMANSLVVEMPGDALLWVSTPSTAHQTEKLLNFFNAAFPGRKTTAISTHFHWDGAGGNATLEAAGIPVYGTSLTVDALKTRIDALNELTFRQPFKSKDVEQQFRDTKLVPPDHLFDAQKGLDLDFSGEKVRVLFPGPAHAPDNLAVWFPSRGLLYGGCMVKSGNDLGNLSDADVARWPASLQVLQKLPAKIVVPGHGAVGDAKLLAHTAELLAARARDAGAH